MELLRDLGALSAWLGALETCVLVAVACLPGLALLPRPALRLAALPALGLLAEGVLAWEPPPTPTPATLEALSWHPVLGPLGCALALPGLVALGRRGLAALRAGRPPRQRAWRLCARWLPLAALPCCWLQPWGIDARLYHLGLPIHRLLGHAAIAGHGNAGFFSLGEDAMLWPLALGSLAAARSAQLWACAWATQAVAALLPGARGGVALAAQALWLASPAVVWQLGGGYVDVLVAAHEVVALSLLWRWWAAPAAAAAGWALGLGAWLCGAAAGTKALALGDVCGFVLAVGLGLRAQRKRNEAEAAPASPTGALAWGAVGAALVLPFAPFVVRNLMRYHAPLFPFGEALWPGGEGLWPSQHQALAHFLELHGPYDGAWPRRGLTALLALPWALSFDAAFASPRFDGVLGPLPALAAALALVRTLARRRGRARQARAGTAVSVLLRRLVVGFVALRLATWLATSWQARFLFGPLWWCAWAVAAGGVGRLGKPRLRRFARQQVRRRRWRLRLAVAGAASVAFWPSLRGHGPTWDARAFGDAGARHEARVAKFVGSSLCDGPVGELLGAKDAGAQGALLLVWTQRYLPWCLAPVRSDSYDEAASLQQALRAHPGDPLAAARQLRAWGVGELLVDEAWLRYVPPELDAEARLAHGRDWQAYVALRQRALHEVVRKGPLARFRLDVGPPA